MVTAKINTIKDKLQDYSFSTNALYAVRHWIPSFKTIHSVTN